MSPASCFAWRGFFTPGRGLKRDLQRSLTITQHFFVRDAQEPPDIIPLRCPPSSALPQHPEIMLGVLVAILRLDDIAAQRSLTRER